MTVDFDDAGVSSPFATTSAAIRVLIVFRGPSHVQRTDAGIGFDPKVDGGEILVAAAWRWRRRGTHNGAGDGGAVTRWFRDEMRRR